MSFSIFHSVLLLALPIISSTDYHCSEISTSKCIFPSKFHMFIYLSSLRSFVTGIKMSENLMSVDFEIFGRVQGVFFRKCTRDQAKVLGVRGWCKNTPQGTVEGQVQGPSDKIESMKHWLKNTGSPQSLIERAEFKNEQTITKYSFDDFDIVRKRH